MAGCYQPIDIRTTEGTTPKDTNIYKRTETIWNDIMSISKICVKRRFHNLQGGVHQSKQSVIYKIIVIINSYNSTFHKNDNCVIWEIGMGVPVLTFALEKLVIGNSMVVSNDIGKIL